jgi:hypothetical protein
MRTLMRVSVPAEKGTAALADGSMQRVIQQTIEKVHPEAAYFFPLNGQRTALFVFDLPDSSQVPAIAEPFFAAFNAEVYMTPVMNAEDLQKGLASI